MHGLHVSHRCTCLNIMLLLKGEFICMFITKSSTSL